MIKKRIKKGALSKLKKFDTNQNRIKKIHNLETVSNVGILWSYNADHGTKEFDKLCKLFKDQGCNIKSMGYLPVGVHKESVSQIIQSDLISEKETSWTGKSKLPEFQEFINTKFDILIDLTIEELLVIQHLGVHSKADFKIGMNKSFNYYDLTIDLNGQRSQILFITEMMEYLKRIKIIKK